MTPYAEVFNHRYGTQVDKVLHEELCDTRVKMRTLHSEYPDNFYLQHLTPVIHYYTALAKTQRDPTVAFSLSDFCNGLTRIVSGGINFVVKTVSAVSRGVFSFPKK